MTQSVVAAMSDIIKQSGGELSRSKAGMITCPVLLIAGEHDMFAPPAIASELAARIRAAEVLVAELPKEEKKGATGGGGEDMY